MERRNVHDLGGRRLCRVTSRRPGVPLSMLRILIADDHPIVRRGLKELLEEQTGWGVCAEAGDGREAVELALRHRPNVAVLDLSMPELNGLEATRRIRAALPETEVLVFTMHDSEELIGAVLEAGAKGYLLKSDAALQLVPAVQSLAQGKPFFAGRVSEVLLEGYLHGRPGQPTQSVGGRLTSREREILQLLAEGHGNKDIAGSLDLSERIERLLCGNWSCVRFPIWCALRFATGSSSLSRCSTGCGLCAPATMP
jgi:DNA-binding NarL/FixJ family response regulator